jgi:hypothetical protein
VFEDRVRRKIFGPRRDEVIGEWKRLPENLHGGQMGGAREEKCIQGSAGETWVKEATWRTHT